MVRGRWRRRILVATLAMLGLVLVGWGVLLHPSMYFRTAFHLIRFTSVMGDRIDWPSVRARALERMGTGWRTRAAYPAIQSVLESLGDHHSHFLPPAVARLAKKGSFVTSGVTVVWPERVVAQVIAGGPADGASVRVGDVVETVNGQPPTGLGGQVRLPNDRPLELLLRRPGAAEPLAVRITPRVAVVNLPATVRRLGGAIGYIDVPAVVGGGPAFDEQAVAAIRQADATPTCGWVVDLRRDYGGNMWPMLHAVRPILGEDTPGYFVSGSSRDPWSYAFGKGPGASAPVYFLKKGLPPVAVLTSRLTVSSGEALTIAFRGRPDTRSFGEATGGLSSANTTIPMVDGALLVVTTSREADRTGRVYEGRIDPDQPMNIDWALIESDSEPVLGAATAWLASQPACAGTGQEPPTR